LAFGPKSSFTNKCQTWVGFILVISGSGRVPADIYRHANASVELWLIPMYCIGKILLIYISNISISNLSIQWTRFQHCWFCLQWQEMFTAMRQCLNCVSQTAT